MKICIKRKDKINISSQNYKTTSVKIFKDVILGFPSLMNLNLKTLEIESY